MRIATANANRRKERPAQEVRLDLYDPHFPVRQRAKDASERISLETFDPHFPPLKPHRLISVMELAQSSAFAFRSREVRRRRDSDAQAQESAMDCLLGRANGN